MLHTHAHAVFIHLLLNIFKPKAHMIIEREQHTNITFINIKTRLYSSAKHITVISIQPIFCQSLSLLQIQVLYVCTCVHLCVYV